VLARNRQSRAPTRGRILEAAKHLLQQRGYHGVGTAEILAVANAPKGSMYHHFPDGKEQIAIAAVQLIRAEVAGTLNALTSRHLSAAQIIRRLAVNMGAWLKASQWREGTMLAAAVIGSVPESPPLHAAIRAAFAEWRQQLMRLLIREGRRERQAHCLADTIVAGLEGAMLLARVDQDERVLTNVAETLASLVAAKE
jgi:TetR/AcrR family transcriptional repressor of lmrAB and yxaGH operons